MTLQEVINEFEEGLDKLKSEPNSKDNSEACKFVKNVLSFLYELRERRKTDKQDNFFPDFDKSCFKPVFESKEEYLEYRDRGYEELEPLIKENERIRKETWQEAIQNERKF